MIIVDKGKTCLSLVLAFCDVPFEFFLSGMTEVRQLHDRGVTVA